jgi:Mg2+/citrate symporter
MAMEIMNRPIPEEESEAVALATIIFAAGFFLGIGTGMLLGSGAGSGVRGRLRNVVDHLMGDVAKGVTDAVETGKHMLTKEGMPGRS